jgi:hypothetical protein
MSANNLEALFFPFVSIAETDGPVVSAYARSDIAKGTPFGASLGTLVVQCLAYRFVKERRSCGYSPSALAFSESVNPSRTA